MAISFLHKNSFLRLKSIILAVACCCLSIMTALSLSSCHTATDYFSYVSELRDNVFIGENDILRLRAYALEKESPYLTDGIPCEKNTKAEIYVSAPSSEKVCEISFTVNNENIRGEMSYDNVKGEYFFAYPISISTLTSIVFTISYGDETFSITANSVKTAQTLSPQAILQSVVNSEKELFSNMTDKYGFTGEIYMRFIYEDAPFYYVGIIQRNGNVTAFLLNANTGKILAKRQ